MAKETKTITSYKTFTLSIEYKFPSGMRQSVSIALFDDVVLAKAYLKSSGGVIDVQKAKIHEDWTSLKPCAENTNLPFNPKWSQEKFEAFFTPIVKVKARRFKVQPANVAKIEVEKPVEEAKPTGKAPKVPKTKKAKVEDVEGMIGLKIGRRGGASKA